MDVEVHDDGGATVRLSHLELVGYYNLLNGFLQEAKTQADGSPIPPEWTHAQRIQLHQLAVAIGRTDVPHPDE